MSQPIYSHLLLTKTTIVFFQQLWATVIQCRICADGPVLWPVIEQHVCKWAKMVQLHFWSHLSVRELRDSNTLYDSWKSKPEAFNQTKCDFPPSAEPVFRKLLSYPFERERFKTNRWSLSVCIEAIEYRSGVENSEPHLSVDLVWAKWGVNEPQLSCFRLAVCFRYVFRSWKRTRLFKCTSG